MNNIDLMKYWFESSDSDFDTMKVLFENHKNTWCLFIGHLVIEKLLKSAIANAENNNGMSVENLYVEECYANKGPTMKRIRPRAQGRAYRIEKRMSHITLVLNER